MRYIICLFCAYLCTAITPLQAADGNYTSTLQFIQNAGQIVNQLQQPRTDIDYKLEANGMTIFAGSGQLHYQWTKVAATGELQEEQTTIYRMDVTLLGANKQAQVLAEQPTGYYEHYYTGATPDGAMARGYRKVIYKNIYPHIDWVLYTQQQGRRQSLKYDFVVHPGGNPADIRLQYSGATELLLAEGTLTATTPFGSITEGVPYSYDAATKAAVATQYVVDGNTVQFQLAAHDAATLVIDPSLSWATYYGGTERDFFSGVIDDTAGNVTLYGSTRSTTHIATSGAHQTTMNGAPGTTVGLGDVFLAHFDLSGTRLWATYYGGTGYDNPNAATTDDAGNIYLCGFTGSDTGIATAGTYQSSRQGAEGFFVKFNSSGVRQWGSYIGGIAFLSSTGIDDAYCIALDAANNIYVGGSMDTIIPGFITPNVHDTVSAPPASAPRGYLAKFNPSGNKIWATYIRGLPYALGVDDFNTVNLIGIITAGNTFINQSIASPGAFQSTYGGGPEDAFIMKFDTAGTRIWGTFYGGSNRDAVFAGASDRYGNTYITGYSESSSGIASPGAYSTNHNQRVFIAKFNNSGQRAWGTFYGGQTFNLSLGQGLTVTPTGAIYLAGLGSVANIISPDALNTNNLAGTFIQQYHPDGYPVYNTNFGGSNGSTSTGNRLPNLLSSRNRYGKLYIAGTTSATAGFATPGAHQDTLNANRNHFLAQIDQDTIVYVKPPFNDTVFCKGDTIFVNYGATKPFRTGNTFTVQLSNSSGSFASPTNLGSISYIDDSVIACPVTAGLTSGEGYRIRIISTMPVDTSIDNGYNISIGSYPQNVSTGSNSPLCEDDSLTLTSATTSSNVTYTWTGPGSYLAASQSTGRGSMSFADSGKYIVAVSNFDCITRDTVTVTVLEKPEFTTVSTNSPVCPGDTLELNASSTTGINYRWTGPASYLSFNQNATRTSMTTALAGAYRVTTTASNNCVSDTAILIVNVQATTPKPTGTGTTPICAGQDIILFATNVPGATYQWWGPSLFSSNTQNPVRQNVNTAAGGEYYLTATLNNCVSDTDTVAIVVKPSPEVNIFPTPGTSICDGQEAVFTAVGNNAGTNLQYLWLVNNVSTGITTPTYKTSGLNNNDVVHCQMISTGVCLNPFTDTSNPITMTVLQTLAPSVSITATPNTSLFPNEPVSFTATPTDAGNRPDYQWLRNGVPVGGATSSIWGANANFLNDGDEICAMIYSDYECPSPDSAKSNCIKLQIRVSVENINTASNIKIYPNPTSDHLFIKGADKGTAISLYDVTGRLVYESVTEQEVHSMSVSQLPTGHYILQLTDTNGNRSYSKVNKE